VSRELPAVHKNVAEYRTRSRKHAIDTPLMHPGVDTTDAAHYVPLSNVTFICCCRHHSTQTAILRALSGVLTAADAEQ